MPPAMRGRGSYRAILATSALMGCGDTPLCDREVFVAFVQTPIAIDVDGFTPGVQTNVRIKTSLHTGDLVTLEIVDPAGPSGPGDSAGERLLDTVARAVDDDGAAAFYYVTVPPPRVTLRAAGRGICGEARDEITIDVPAIYDRNSR
ncbi:MAG TPA: hypothetical protein VGD37_17345 [Kofleriaceae bacterium]|jgi:hypothetical protein